MPGGGDRFFREIRIAAATMVLPYESSTSFAKVWLFGRKVRSKRPSNAYKPDQGLRVGFVILHSHGRREVHYFDSLALRASRNGEV